MRLLLSATFLILTGAAACAGEVGALGAETQRLGTALAQLQETSPRGVLLEARLAQIEEELRRLTGRIEELEHQQAQLSARLDRQQAAAAARPGDAPSGPMLPPPARAPASPPPAAPPPSSIEPPSPPIEPDAAARQGYVLGAVPQEALRNAPTPPGRQAGLPPRGADAYQDALDLLQAGKWAEAEAAFAAFVEANPDDPKAATAAYWQAETLYFRKDYRAAAAMFAGNYRRYGENAPKAADNLLKLGMALAASGDRTRACQTFAELAKRHPGAPAPIRQALVRERAAAGCG